MPALFLNRIMKLTIKIVICYFTTHEHLSTAASGTDIRGVSMLMHQNPVWNSGRKNLMIMSEGMLLSERNCRNGVLSA